jgi:hypothetical protein
MAVDFSGHIFHLFGVYPEGEEYAKPLPVGARAHAFAADGNREKTGPQLLHVNH